jgi:hypothetical protein
LNYDALLSKPLFDCNAFAPVAPTKRNYVKVVMKTFGLKNRREETGENAKTSSR